MEKLDRDSEPLPEEAPQVYVYRWNRMNRKGQECVVLCRGSMNSCLVEFVSDHFRAVISRNALRKKAATPSAGL